MMVFPIVILHREMTPKRRFDVVLASNPTGFYNGIFQFLALFYSELSDCHKIWNQSSSLAITQACKVSANLKKKHGNNAKYSDKASWHGQYF